MRLLAEKHYKISLLQRTFKAWSLDTEQEKKRGLESRWQNKLEKVSNNIISQYEAELNKVKT